MDALTYILFPAIAGIGLGTVYFGGLWLTLQRLATSRRPAFLVLGSYLGRMALCFLALLAIARLGGWQGLLVCLAGFITVRFVIVRRLGKPALALERGDATRTGKASAANRKDER